MLNRHVSAAQPCLGNKMHMQCTDHHEAGQTSSHLWAPLLAALNSSVRLQCPSCRLLDASVGLSLFVFWSVIAVTAQMLCRSDTLFSHTACVIPGYPYCRHVQCCFVAQHLCDQQPWGLFVHQGACLFGSA